MGRPRSDARPQWPFRFVRVAAVVLWLAVVVVSAERIPADVPAGEPLAEARLDLERALDFLETGLPADAAEARRLLEPALAVFRQAGVADVEAEALQSLGVAQARLGEADAALDLYQHALELHRELGDKGGQAATLNNMALVLVDEGRANEALAHLEAALPLRRTVADLRGEAATLHNLAALHVQLGELQSGLDAYTQALELHRQLDDPGAKAATLNNLGLVLGQLGEHEPAVDRLRQALALHRAGGNLPGEAGALANLGLANFELDRPAVALGHLTTARKLYQAIGDRSGEADALNNLGMIHLEAEQLTAAGKDLKRSLEIQRGIGDRRGEAAVLANLGQLHRKQRRFDLAKADLKRALDLQRQLGDPWTTSLTLLEFGRLAADQGHLESALESVEEAIRIIESLRADLLSPDFRTSLIGGRRELYDFRVDVLMQLERSRPGQGYVAAALAAAEAARARGLLDSLGEIREGIRHGGDAELVAQRRDLRRRVSARESLRHQLLESASTGGAPTERSRRRAEALNEEIESLLVDYRHLEVELRRRDPRYAELSRPMPLVADEVRRLLDDSTVLLEYSLGDERSYLWTVTSEAVTGHVLAGHEPIEKAARRLHELLTESRGRAFQGPARVAAAEVAALILEPVKDALGKRRVAIVADGALHLVPFGVLPLGGVDGKLLGHGREVVALPSASVLASLRQGRAGRASPTAEGRKTIAILADPVFDSGDPRVGGPRAGDPRFGDPRTGGPLAGTLDADQRAIEPLRAAWPRLVHSRREAQTIAALVPAEQRRVALDFAARRELLVEGALEPFRIVHLATHGVVDSRRPELSALVFSQLDADGQAHDGHLRLIDVYNLRLDADLVVLSACRTALGRETPGEGLISLARGFLYAGASQVLTSLWQVDDEATAVLMEHFYRALLVEGQTAAASLRSAQTAVASDRRWQAPYYWAGFVLLGDWR